MAETRKTVLLTMAVYALESLPFGAWLAMIPVVMEQLALNKAQLAIALLGMPVGVIPCLQIAGWLMSRIGPRRVLAVAFPAQALVLCLPLFATGVANLFFALVCFGCVVAMLQIGLNVYAGRLEKQRGLTVMSRCHGFGPWGLWRGHC